MSDPTTGDISRLIAVFNSTPVASGRSSRVLVNLTRALVWLTFVLASSAVVSLTMALLR